MTQDEITYAGSKVLSKQALDALKLASKANTVIEIAGPSPDGYMIFKDHKIAMPKLWITNKFNPVHINPYGESPLYAKVDQKVNASRLPYKKDSVDAFFTSYLTINSDIVNIYPRIYPHWLDRFTLTLALKEYESNRKPIFNVRARLFCQAMLMLKPGGIIVMVGAHNLDYPYAKKVGFKVLVKNYPASDSSYTAVFQKPNITH